MIVRIVPQNHGAGKQHRVQYFLCTTPIFYNIFLRLFTWEKNINHKVDAAPVHLANGVWGVIAAGLFASEEGYSASYYADRSER